LFPAFEFQCKHLIAVQPMALGGTFRVCFQIKCARRMGACWCTVWPEFRDHQLLPLPTLCTHLECRWMKPTGLY